MNFQKDFRYNHYVPEWYQKRFELPGQNQYYYLDLHPEEFVDNGHRYTRTALRRLGPRRCFAENDLYTTKWGTEENVDIEKFFFGRVDTEGKSAVEFFGNFHFDIPGQGEALESLLKYMSVQKLRTPKGFGWLSTLPSGRDRNLRLMMLQEVQQIFCATWTDCVWQIADAANSPTKFIISDRPVTVYNRGCFPTSKWCVGFNDPDIRSVATHTYFPLSFENILILTNLSWVRNPYQKELSLYPNQRLFRHAIFNLQDIQTHRILTEQEVQQINYITKKRALRYVAGADLDWLYPENFLRSTHWSKFGRGLLFMPEPREISMGGETYVKYESGAVEGWNEYGHRPWERAFKDSKRDAIESRTLERFKAEWSMLQGPEYRGTSSHFDRHLGGPYTVPDEFHQYYLKCARLHRNLPRATR